MKMYNFMIKLYIIEYIYVKEYTSTPFLYSLLLAATPLEVKLAGRKGILDCELHWYPKFYNHVMLFVGSNN